MDPEVIKKVLQRARKEGHLEAISLINKWNKKFIQQNQEIDITVKKDESQSYAAHQESEEVETQGDQALHRKAFIAGIAATAGPVGWATLAGWSAGKKVKDLADKYYLENGSWPSKSEWVSKYKSLKDWLDAKQYILNRQLIEVSQKYNLTVIDHDPESTSHLAKNTFFRCDKGHTFTANPSNLKGCPVCNAVAGKERTQINIRLSPNNSRKLHEVLEYFREFKGEVGFIDDDEWENWKEISQNATSFARYILEKELTDFHAEVINHRRRIELAQWIVEMRVKIPEAYDYWKALYPDPLKEKKKNSEAYQAYVKSLDRHVKGTLYIRASQLWGDQETQYIFDLLWPSSIDQSFSSNTCEESEDTDVSDELRLRIKKLKGA